jgi:adenine-specific DNA-methyltransferase
VTGDTLTLYFTYEPVDKKLKREALLQQAFETVKNKIPADFLEVLKPDPTPANKTRTLLQKHLNDYTARNTFDYFIHKDLGGFLRRELDFYIKNEVLFIDDINTRSEGEFLQQLSLLKAIKTIGEKIITFLASLEDFQKKLWLKKKFVVETNYCVTLNRVPKELYPLIAANEAQTAEWVKLFAIDEIIGSEATEIFGRSTVGFKMPLTVEFLEQNPYLVLDTAFFDADFKVVLLQSFDDIEEAIDGLLIHGENFQALQLLQERYQEQVKCVYIDPPYNTGDDGFPYKDNFQHSSWISFIVDRLHLGGLMQTKDGTITISIDDKEVENLQRVLLSTYGEQELAKLVWDRNKKNDAKFFSVGHEYMIVYAKDKQWLKNNKVKYREPREGLGEAQTYYAKLLKKYETDWSKIKEGWDNFFENMVMSDPRKRMSRFGKVGPKGPYRDDGNINWPGGGGPTYEIKHPSTNKPVKIPKSGWRYPTKERFWEEYDKGKIVFGKDETTVPSIRSFLFESKTQIMPSVFYSYAQTASQEFEAIFGKKVFDNPKNWRDILRVISYLSDFNSIILDYFVGSGTTGHAVINLNRRDKSKRKYILVEMGDYFDTVTKPRIQKVVYSKDWKDGKPLNREGISHCFKYIRLESYEDTLNNLDVRRGSEQELALEHSPAFKEGYLLQYMLEVESRQSLLNTEWFVNPFNFRLNITRQNETVSTPVDLVETFNYLIGLKVKTVTRPKPGYVVVAGANRKEESILVVWRDCTLNDNTALNEFLRKSRYNPLDNEFNRIYVNGDNNVENLKTGEEQWKVVLIEEEFKRRMFEA